MKTWCALFLVIIFVLIQLILEIKDREDTKNEKKQVDYKRVYVLKNNTADLRTGGQNHSLHPINEYVHEWLISNATEGAHLKSSSTSENPSTSSDTGLKTSSKNTSSLTLELLIPTAEMSLPADSGPTIPTACLHTGQPTLANCTGGAMIFEPSIQSSRPVYDVFLFNNEFAMLEIRLTELHEVVDTFIIVELPYTTSGKPKRLHYQENRERYARFKSKIVTVTHNMSEKFCQDSWSCERAARLLGLDALKDVSGDALVLFSDVDEVPSCWNVYVLKHAPNMPGDKFIHLDMPLFYYNMRWRSKADFSNSLAFLRSYMDIFQRRNSLTQLFFSQTNKNLPKCTIANAGWHCSYCFSMEKIVVKLQSFAHTEYSLPPYTDLGHIRPRYEQGRDLFDRPRPFQLVPDGQAQSFPHAVRQDPARYRMFFPAVAPDGVSIVYPTEQDFAVDAPLRLPE